MSRSHTLCISSTVAVVSRVAPPFNELPIEPSSDAGCRCGWFDSSHELSQGLVVTEDVDTDLLQLWARVAARQH